VLLQTDGNQELGRGEERIEAPDASNILHVWM